LAEEKCLELEKNIKLLNSDYKYLKDDMSKKEREFNDELVKYMNMKKELESDLFKRNQDMADLSSELSNFKIKEKHFNKISSDLKEENSQLKEECDKYRKISIDAENVKVKKLQEEIEELKTMNQLYRSQRLESDEEINNCAREIDRLKAECVRMRKEHDELMFKFEQQRQKAESEYSARYMVEQRALSLEQALNLQEQKSDEMTRKYLAEMDSLKEEMRNGNAENEDLKQKIKSLKDEIEEVKAQENLEKQKLKVQINNEKKLTEEVRFFIIIVFIH
jgi:chromosome segregation ATPase